MSGFVSVLDTYEPVGFNLSILLIVWTLTLYLHIVDFTLFVCLRCTCPVTVFHTQPFWSYAVSISWTIVWDGCSTRLSWWSFGHLASMCRMSVPSNCDVEPSMILLSRTAGWSIRRLSYGQLLTLSIWSRARSAKQSLDSWSKFVEHEDIRSSFIKRTILGTTW